MDNVSWAVALFDESFIRELARQISIELSRGGKAAGTMAGADDLETAARYMDAPSALCVAWFS